MPVVGITPERIAARTDYFRQMVDIQASAPWAKELEISFHPNSLDLVSQMYFVISEDYKRRLLKSGTLTDFSKVAAFTCAAIIQIKPLRVMKAPTNSGLASRGLYINGLFALRCACNIIEHPIDRRGFDELKRWCDQILKIDLPSLKPMLQEALANNGLLTTDWSIELSYAEHDEIKKLVNLFYVLERLKIYANNKVAAGTPTVEEKTPR